MTGFIQPTLLVHGGAGRIREFDRPHYEAGLRQALTGGYEALAESAEAAVLKAVKVMEDNPVAFNAGTGGAPNRNGIVECDACIMCSDGSSGAVASLTRAKNPVLVAEQVRRGSPHAFIVGLGADALVDDPIPNSELLTERSQEQLKRWRAKGGTPEGSATVGAVALDATGRLAAATSTGGLLGKWPGRVGDAPVVGAGTYADTQVAVSCTGAGEAFLRAVAAKTLALRLDERGLASCLELALIDVENCGGDGGLITVTADGQIGFGWNTPHLAYGYKTALIEVAKVGLEAGITVI